MSVPMGSPPGPRYGTPQRTATAGSDSSQATSLPSVRARGGMRATVAAAPWCCVPGPGPGLGYGSDPGPAPDRLGLHV